MLYVICKIAGAEYAISAADVAQMESFSPVTPVPGSPHYVRGLIQIRQQIVPVIDARMRMGLPAQEPTEESRFVILKFGARVVSLLVDSAREVRSISESQFHKPPDLTSGEGGFIKAVANFKENIVMLIDGLKVVGEETVHG